MKSGELQRFRAALLEWFYKYRRDLPWRTNRDAYRIWVSEIMLQQTRVAAVIPYYEKFLARFPTLQALAKAPPEEVLRLWSGLGYYSRARNLQKAAQQIVANHQGQFPRKREEVLALSGIGEYTAAAILSIGFDEPLAVLDGNVARVIARVEAVRDVGEPSRWRGLQETANQMLAQESSGDWNQAMMELGATVCTPKSPQCLLCPAAEFCKARKLGIADSLPEKRKKRATVAVRLVSVVLLDAKNNSLLLPPPETHGKSQSDDHVPSLVAKLWHFPTLSAPGKPGHALKKLLQEELRDKKQSSVQPESLEEVRHTVTYRAIIVYGYLLRVKRLPEIAGAKTVPLDEVSTLAISSLTRKIAGAAMRHLFR